MLYIVLDPGKSTGMNVIRDGQLEFGCTVEDFNWQWLMEKVHTLVEHEKHVLIITEEFRVYPGMGVQQALQPMWSSQINGMLDYFVYLRQKEGQDISLVRQWASTAKTYATDDKLKQHGLWKGTKHQKDSARHYIYYIENSKKKTALKS